MFTLLLLQSNSGWLQSSYFLISLWKVIPKTLLSALLADHFAYFFRLVLKQKNNRFLEVLFFPTCVLINILKNLIRQINLLKLLTASCRLHCSFFYRNTKAFPYSIRFAGQTLGFPHGNFLSWLPRSSKLSYAYGELEWNYCECRQTFRKNKRSYVRYFERKTNDFMIGQILYFENIPRAVSILGSKRHKDKV